MKRQRVSSYRRRVLRRALVNFGLLIALGWPPADQARPSEGEAAGADGRSLPPADRIVAAVEDLRLQAICREVLRRNPELARLARDAEAAEARPAQAGALPDPMASVLLYLMSPETRVGPQRAMVSLSQRFPWFGKLGLAEQAAVLRATAARARLEARRLSLVTEARTLYYEVAFVDTWIALTRADQETLSHYEEIARARYAAGIGLQQGIVKLQAEITRDETKILDLEARRARLVARLNALRDLPEPTPLQVVPLPAVREVGLEWAALRDQAVEHRPELAAASAEIEAAERMVALARKQYRPDVTVALGYALVDRRNDPAGLVNPPPDNGQDVLSLSAGVNLPVRRRRLAAGVAEAVALRSAAEERRRDALNAIQRELEDLTSRLPLTWQRLTLLDGVLLLQAEEALRSAESAYAAGSVNALDLLDAERVLFEIRTAAARARTDYAVLVATLAGAVASPLEALPGTEDLP